MFLRRLRLEGFEVEGGGVECGAVVYAVEGSVGDDVVASTGDEMTVDDSPDVVADGESGSDVVGG